MRGFLAIHTYFSSNARPWLLITRMPGLSGLEVAWQISGAAVLWFLLLPTISMLLRHLKMLQLITSSS